MRLFAQYFAIEKRINAQGHKIKRADLVFAFTTGKKNGLSELTTGEYREFIAWLNLKFPKPVNNWQDSPENKMRRKVFALLVYKVGYTESQLHGWVEKYSPFKKPLNDHNLKELTVITTQAEKVYRDFVNGVSA